MPFVSCPRSDPPKRTESSRSPSTEINGMSKRKQLLVGCGEWGFRELPMEEHFRITAEFGMKYLEFGIGGDQTGRLPAEPSESDIAEFLALGEKYEIKTPFCCLENDFTLGDPVEHEKMLAGVIAQIHAAAACKATHVRLFAGFTPIGQMDKGRWTRMLDAFRQCNDLCQELGLQIAIETHGALNFHGDGSATHTSTITTHGLGLARLLKELPTEIGFNYDPGNIKAAEPEIEDLHLELLNPRINYCHLKDWRRTDLGWIACAIGDDDLDYESLLGDLEFAGVCLIEYEPLADPEDGIRRSLEYLHRVVEHVVFE